MDVCTCVCIYLFERVSMWSGSEAEQTNELVIVEPYWLYTTHIPSTKDVRLERVESFKCTHTYQERETFTHAYNCHGRRLILTPIHVGAHVCIRRALSFRQVARFSTPITALTCACAFPFQNSIYIYFMMHFNKRRRHVSCCRCCSFKSSAAPF